MRGKEEGSVEKKRTNQADEKGKGFMQRRNFDATSHIRSVPEKHACI